MNREQIVFLKRLGHGLLTLSNELYPGKTDAEAIAAHQVHLLLNALEAVLSSLGVAEGISTLRDDPALHPRFVRHIIHVQELPEVISTLQLQEQLIAQWKEELKANGTNIDIREA